MNRLPASPLITKGLEIAENRVGIDELSRRLGATADMIRSWRFGHSTMPERKFLQLVDLLTELDPDWTDKIERPG